MRYKTYSEDYETERINYPEKWDFECIACGSEVTFEYDDNGKLVHTLQGDVNQVVSLYSCTNPDCKLSGKVFNPAPKFDYSNRHYGADVFRFIADEYLLYKQKPKQIYERLRNKYLLSISQSTVNRICDDILLLKSHQIDENTLQIIQEQGEIVLGLDGQDPGKDAPRHLVLI